MEKRMRGCGRFLRGGIDAWSGREGGRCRSHAGTRTRKGEEAVVCASEYADCYGLNVGVPAESICQNPNLKVVVKWDLFSH